MGWKANIWPGLSLIYLIVHSTSLWMAITPSLEKILLESLKDPLWVLYYFPCISMICLVYWKIVRAVYNYADDTNLSTLDETLSNAQQKLNKDWKTLGNWLHVNKLSANLVKTESMITTSAHELKSVNYSPLITLSKKPINRVHQTDYIDLVMDEKLSWKEYIAVSPYAKRSLLL